MLVVLVNILCNVLLMLDTWWLTFCVDSLSVAKMSSVRVDSSYSKRCIIFFKELMNWAKCFQAILGEILLLSLGLRWMLLDLHPLSLGCEIQK